MARFVAKVKSYPYWFHEFFPTFGSEQKSISRINYIQRLCDKTLNL